MGAFGRSRGVATRLAAWAITGAIAGAIASAVALTASPAPAQSCVSEIEPNDAPETAQPVAGSFCIAGGAGGPGRDVFRWSLSPDDAARLWTLRVEGFPGQRVTVALEGLDGAGTPVSVAAEPSGFDAELADLRLVPGEHLITVATEGGPGLYRLEALRGEPQPPEGVQFRLVASGGRAEAVWRLGQEESAQRWSLFAEMEATGQPVLGIDLVSGASVLTRYARDGSAWAPDLGLEAGEYRIFVRNVPDGSTVVLRAEPEGPRDAGYVEEPNDGLSSAFPFEPGRPLTGRLLGDPFSSDTDLLRLDLDESWRDRRFDLVARAPQEIHLALLADDGTVLQERSGSGTLRLADLVLDPGTAIVRLRGRLEGSETYTIEVEDRGPARPGEEREPNDQPSLASPLGPDGVGVGRFVGTETDSFVLTVEGELQLWTLEAEGDGLARLVLQDPSGAGEVRADRQGGVAALRLSNLLLLPGRHVVSVRGTDGPYRLRAVPQGPFDAARDEIEPNDRPVLAQRLAFDLPRRGLLDRPGDRDVYRFTLPGETSIRLTFDGTPDVDTRLILSLDDGATETARIGRRASSGPAVWEGWLPAGDHYVALDATGVSEVPYGLLLERLPWFGEPDDLEPNDAWWAARPLPSDFRIRGRLHGQDADWFRLPTLEAGTEIVLTASGAAADGAYARVVAVAPPDAERPWAGRPIRTVSWFAAVADGSRRTTVPETGDLYLAIESGGGGGPYEVVLDFRPGPAAVPPSDAEHAVSLVLDEPAVASFWPQHQRVHGVATLRSRAAEPIELVLAAHAGDERWVVTLERERIVLEPGAETLVPVVVEIAPGAVDDGPLPVAVAATDSAGRRAWAEASVEPEMLAPPVGAFVRPPLPEALLGGINPAWAALGGEISPDGDSRLIDGLAGASTTARLNLDRPAEDQPVLTLAGAGPVEIGGFVLAPAPFAQVRDRLDAFAVSVSLDGQSFERVLEGRLPPRGVEHAFPLEAPVPARFVRLEPLSSHRVPDGFGTTAELGEFRVIAAGPGPFGHLDIAAPERGGHIVWMTPGFDSMALLTEAASPAPLWLDAQSTAPVEWVLAFLDNRAARIVELQWQDRSNADLRSLVPAVILAASTQSASGPWIEIGTWTLERDADGSVAPFRPAEPVWARYLRYTLAPTESGRGVALPDLLGVVEQAAGDDYRSILGAWGAGRREAIYERLVPGAAVAAIPPVVSSTPAEPLPLLPEVEAVGAVRLGASEAWYRLDVPEGQSQLSLTLGGPEPGRILLSLEGPAGEPVVLRRGASAGTEAITHTAEIGPGPHLLRVSEPPRSVIVTWDTSGSVGHSYPAVVQTVLSLVASIEPGREAINLIPFRGERSVPLLETWSEEPIEVYRALQAYDWSDSSSNTEAAMLSALGALRERPGRRAVVVITDAESDGARLSGPLWQAMGEVGPRVFAIWVATGARGVGAWESYALMHDLAAHNGGFVAPLAAPGDGDAIFRRLAASFRDPAPYTLTATLAETPSEPGWLEVAAIPVEEDAPALVAEAAIAIILDASGSMLQRLEGARRIDTAKALLAELVTDTLPEGVPVALRVFGLGGPHSCATDLVLPLAPLDRGRALAAIRPIQPANLARTAIGASLRAVAGDLAEATGPRLVILVTDGEETCDGDPASEIEALRSAGIDVRVNIVGFALDDPALAAMFETWADAGGGRYFEAADAAGLEASLEAAVRPSFEVVDAANETVAVSVVGAGPVELPAGAYRIRILAVPPLELEGVAVRPGEVTTVRPDSGAMVSAPAPAPVPSPAPTPTPAPGVEVASPGASEPAPEPAPEPEAKPMAEAPPAPEAPGPPLVLVPPAPESTVGRAEVARAQALLAALGYDPGPVDGAFGRRTAAAILAFETDRGLAPVGSLTAESFALIEREAAVAGVSTGPGPAPSVPPATQPPVTRPPATQPPPATPAPGPSATLLSGRARALSTDRIEVGGRLVVLAGVSGVGDPAAVAYLQAFLDGQGGTATCRPVGAGHACTTASGHDIGHAVLYNGAGRLGPGAPADYAAAEARARSMRLGVWR